VGELLSLRGGSIPASSNRVKAADTSRMSIAFCTSTPPLPPAETYLWIARTKAGRRAEARMRPGVILKE